MTRGRAILAATLAGVIAACGANSAPSPSPSPGRTSLEAAGGPTEWPTTTPITSQAPTDSQPTSRPSLSPRVTPKPTPVPIPPKPAGVKFSTRSLVDDEDHYADVTQTVRWRTPRTADVEIRVYGVTRCIAEPKNAAPNTSGPCLVTGTPLPASVRTLLAKAPASDGVARWSWTEETGCNIGLAYDPEGPLYHAVVLAAYNANGHSIFAIAEPGGWWVPGPDEVIC